MGGGREMGVGGKDAAPVAGLLQSSLTGWRDFFPDSDPCR